MQVNKGRLVKLLIVEREFQWLNEHAEFGSSLLNGNDNKANFTIDQLPSDHYDIVVCVSSYKPFVYTNLFVEQGEERSLELSLQADDLKVQVVGKYTLEGADVEGHEGISISTVGRPFSTTTASSGAFELSLPAGRYTLKASYNGYIDKLVSEIMIPEVEVHELTEQILSRDRSAGVRAQFISPFPDYNWDETIISLTGEQRIPDLRPTPTGQFEFMDLTPDIYVLEVLSPGHADYDRIVDLRQGVIDLGKFLEVESQNVPVMQGRVLLADQANEGNHGEIFIQAYLQEDNLFTTTQTDEAGYFTFTAAQADFKLIISKDGYISQEINVLWNQGNQNFEVNGELLTQIQISV